MLIRNKNTKADDFEKAPQDVKMSTSDGTQCGTNEEIEAVKDAIEKLKLCNASASEKCSLGSTVNGTLEADITRCKPLLETYITTYKVKQINV